MTLSGLWDRIPPAYQVTIIGLFATALPYVQDHYTTWNLPKPAVAVVGALLPFAVLWVTALTEKFGYVSKGTRNATATVSPPVA